MRKLESIQDNGAHKFLWYFEIQGHLISARRADQFLVNKKKRTCHLVEYAFPAGHRGKMKESEKIDKYLDIARELRNMKIIPSVVGELRTIPNILGGVFEV